MSSKHAFARSGAARPPEGTIVANQQRWGRAWKATADGWRPSALTEEERCNGWAMAYLRAFAAVYATDDTVWLQVGARAWDVTGIRRVVQTSERARAVAYSLELADGTTARVELRLPPGVVAARLMDPTYDEIDSWADDIMKVFPYVASDGWTASETTDVQEWVGRVQSMWRSGFHHGP